MSTPTTPPQDRHTTATADTAAAADTAVANNGAAGPGEPATVTVHLFAGAAAAYGAETALVHGATVAEAITHLTEGASPEAVTAIECSSLLVNSVSCTDRSRALTEGDRIDVLPPFAGG